MEAHFKIENDLYKLDFDTKVSITINEEIYTGKVLPKLREINNKLKIGIPITKNLTTNSLAQKIIRQLNSKNITVKRKTNSDKSQDVKILSNKSDCYDSLSEVKKEKLKNSDIPKLLIIACSDSKQQGGNHAIQNPNDAIGALLPAGFRVLRKGFYNTLFNNNPAHFFRNGNNLFNRFNLANRTAELIKAYQRYNGNFYNDSLRNNYLRINQQNNFHILIISGLYGLLDFEDHIIDYHLTINQGGNWYQNNIHDAVIEYMNNNGISDEDVYYSLSNNYTNALIPNANWNNLWQGGLGRGWVSANYLDNFLSNI